MVSSSSSTSVVVLFLLPAAHRGRPGSGAGRASAPSGLGIGVGRHPRAGGARPPQALGGHQVGAGGRRARPRGIPAARQRDQLVQLALEGLLLGPGGPGDGAAQVRAVGLVALANALSKKLTDESIY